ncbi:nucleotidyltransferase family protein [Peptococcaceae bacterium]|jgi:predicted nucleotidyltransferase|nr:nucleotidyltransferase family protein [Peptococcaceae bacterium]
MKKFREIKEIINQRRKELEEKYKVKSIAIFGSYVRGEQIEDSDIDILVEFKEPVSLLHIVSVENYLSDILGIKVDVIPKKNIREELREIILSEAIQV